MQQVIMNVKLVCVTPNVPVGEIAVRNLPAVLGRSLDADLRVDDRWISRVHCEISEIRGTLVVRDLKSSNGTLVNGRCIEEAHLLPGDRLTVGMTSFEIQYTQNRITQHAGSRNGDGRFHASSGEALGCASK
jgi:pSer/pThr/pTyr-binding forkhead associated (FHA) protein